MIVVKVELWSAITGQHTELARATICNLATGTRTRGDYEVRAHRGRDAASLEKSMQARTATHQGVVRNHARLQEHVWNLVAKSLTAMGYGVPK